MADKSKTLNYKVVIVGRSAVGKSCLLLRFTDDRFVEDYLTTVGVDFKFRTLRLRGESFKLQIWDTAGQERYQTITKTFYKGAHAIVLVYDLTSKTSYNEVKDVWLEEARKQADAGVVYMLVGNKMDLEDKIEVDYAEVEKFAKEQGLLSFKTSAKSSKNVEEAFFKLTEEIYDRSLKHQAKEVGVKGEKLEDKAKDPSAAKGCC